MGENKEELGSNVDNPELLSHQNNESVCNEMRLFLSIMTVIL